MSLGNVLGPLSAGLVFDFNINYPFISGLGLLIITLLIALAWRSPRAAITLALLKANGASEAESLV